MSNEVDKRPCCPQCGTYIPTECPRCRRPFDKEPCIDLELGGSVGGCIDMAGIVLVVTVFFILIAVGVQEVVIPLLCQ